MTSEQFAYWLQGFAELNDGPPSAEQWQSIRDHLQAVFVKVTPNRASGFAQGIQTQCANDWMRNIAASNQQSNVTC
jgi:hypothetical protein